MRKWPLTLVGLPSVCLSLSVSGTIRQVDTLQSEQGRRRCVTRQRKENGAVRVHARLGGGSMYECGSACWLGRPGLTVVKKGNSDSMPFILRMWFTSLAVSVPCSFCPPSSSASISSSDFDLPYLAYASAHLRLRPP